MNSFGIISGAGPMAGALLYQQAIALLQAQGAWQDSDFPKIFLLNIPFVNMLETPANDTMVREQLLDSLEQLYEKVDCIYIACQTLHGFLTRDEIIYYRVISLLDLIKAEVSNSNKPILVVASRTARRFNLHNHIHDSEIKYLNPQASDYAIQVILKGLKPCLNWLIEKTFENTVVLGCTEFSVVCNDLRFQWVDPISLAALDMVKKFMPSH
ncbi:MAG: aspartate/glutamate racemase family protein [Gammaproteobacteria bacterium]